MVFRGMRLVLPLLGVGLVAVTSASASSPVRLVFNRAEATPHTLVVA
jgi:hypothetical protein